MRGYSIDQLEIGMSASFQKTLTETDVYLYAGITGDLNPAHINEVEAKDGIFHGRICHGMLTAGLISAVLGMKLPGPGTIYCGQDLKFTAPVRIGDTIKAEVVVVELNTERNTAIFNTTCTNQEGKIVIKGQAKVMPPAKEEI